MSGDLVTVCREASRHFYRLVTSESRQLPGIEGMGALVDHQTIVMAQTVQSLMGSMRLELARAGTEHASVGGQWLGNQRCRRNPRRFIAPIVSQFFSAYPP